MIALPKSTLHPYFQNPKAMESLGDEDECSTNQHVLWKLVWTPVPRDTLDLENVFQGPTELLELASAPPQTHQLTSLG